MDFESVELLFQIYGFALPSQYYNSLWTDLTKVKGFKDFFIDTKPEKVWVTDGSQITTVEPEIVSRFKVLRLQFKPDPAEN